MTSPQVCITAISENAILLEWPELICPRQHKHILACEQLIKQRLAETLIDSIAAYSSLIIYYRFEQIPLARLIKDLHQLVATLEVGEQAAGLSNTIEIPVYYHPEAGWDLTHVSQALSLTVEEVIKRHSQTSYTAYALGFTPGFCYLGTLDNSLQLPRRSTPRLNVPKGAVAIAEQQTAVYPNTSPGGWHIIGQTPMAMYRATANNFIPAIAIGQQVRFKPIDRDSFIELGGKLVKDDSK